MFQFHLRERGYKWEWVTFRTYIYVCIQCLAYKDHTITERCSNYSFIVWDRRPRLGKCFAASKIILYILISFIQWQNFAFLWQSSAKEWFIDSKQFFFGLQNPYFFWLPILVVRKFSRFRIFHLFAFRGQWSNKSLYCRCCWCCEWCLQNEIRIKVLKCSTGMQLQNTFLAWWRRMSIKIISRFTLLIVELW